MTPEMTEGESGEDGKNEDKKPDDAESEDAKPEENVQDAKYPVTANSALSEYLAVNMMSEKSCRSDHQRRYDRTGKRDGDQSVSVRYGRV